MGFEAYTVVLNPEQPASLGAEQNNDAVQRLRRDLQQMWPAICLDEAEMQSRPYSLIKGEVRLVYETDQGLVQLLLTPSQGQVSVSLRFAYCNPRGIYEPFTAMVAWLMRRYQMRGYTLASDTLPDLTDPEEVEAILIPSMDYNRRLWQADAGTTEEAILRPSDAIKRFIMPHALSEALR